MYVRLNPSPPKQRYNYPVSVDRPIRLSANLLCCNRNTVKQQCLFYFWIMCVLKCGAAEEWKWSVWTIMWEMKKYQTNILHEIIKGKASCIDHFLRINCLPERVNEEKIKVGIVVTGRRGRRRKILLDDLKGRRRYCHLKEEALDRTIWKARFGSCSGSVVRQTNKWINEWMNICYIDHKIHHIAFSTIIHMCPRSVNKSTYWGIHHAKVGPLSDYWY